MKVYSGTEVHAGTIIVRQRGTRFHPGENVGKGSDDTLFAKANGTVKFGHRKRPQARRRRSRCLTRLASADRIGPAPRDAGCVALMAMSIVRRPGPGQPARW